MSLYRVTPMRDAGPARYVEAVTMDQAVLAWRNRYPKELPARVELIDDMGVLQEAT